MQHSAFTDEPYKAIRTGLIEMVLHQIQALNTELISVKMQLQYIEKYKSEAAFVCLTDLDKKNLIDLLASIVYMEDTDEFAKRFDNFMYGIMIAQIEGMPQLKEVKEGEPIYQAYDFEDYKLKVNRYIEKNRDSIAIHKLRNNIPLTALDYGSLGHIFTGELGTAEDYKREFQDTPFGLLVRKILSRNGIKLN